jgi:hypothetical protein
LSIKKIRGEPVMMGKIAAADGASLAGIHLKTDRLVMPPSDPDETAAIARLGARRPSVACTPVQLQKLPDGRHGLGPRIERIPRYRRARSNRAVRDARSGRFGSRQ